MTRFCRNFTALSLLFLLTASVFAQTDARLRLAQSYERGRNFEAALEIYLDYYQKGNRGYGIIRGIQKSYLNLHRYPELVRFLKNLIRAFPSNLSYKIELGRAYYLNQQKDEALKQWQKTVAEQPSNITVYRFAGRVMTELRLLDEAANLYLQAIKTLKNQENLYREIASIRRAQLDYGRAAKNLLLWYHFNHKQKIYVQSQLTAMAGDEEAALKILTAIQRFSTKHSGDRGLSEFEAAMHIRLKQFAQALEIYKKLKDMNLLLQFAREAVLGKAFPYAIEAYRLALIPKQKEQRTNDIKFKLAKTYYAQAVAFKQQGKSDSAPGALQQAKRILTNLAAQEKDFRARQRSLELQGDIHSHFLHDTQKALSYYQQALSPRRGSSVDDGVRLKIAALYLRQNNLSKALGQYRLISGRQYGAEAEFRSAQIEYFQGRFSPALKQLTRLQSKLSVRDTLFNNILKLRQFIELFRGDSLQLALFASAELAEKQQKYTTAASAFERLFRKDGKLAEEAGFRAARLYERRHALNKSAALLEEMRLHFSQSAQADRALFQLAALKEKQKLPKEALALYLRFITDFPDSFYIDQARENARRLQNAIGEQNQ